MCWIIGIFLCFGLLRGSSSELTRVPGLRPYSERIAFPQFLAMGMNIGSTSNTLECQRIRSDCPDACRKVDRTGCATCTCSNTPRNHGGCPEPPHNCPTSCRKREAGCSVCKCNDEISGSSSSLSRDLVTTKCLTMVMCMLTCEDGYKLGDIVDSRGCQSCRCIQGQQGETKGQNGESANTMPWGGSETGQNGMAGGQTSMTGGWTSGLDSSQENTGSDIFGNAPFGGESTSGTDWTSGNFGGSGSGKKAWPSDSEVGSGGINPMNPGAGMGSGSECTGPFCADGSGMGSAMGGGTSSSTGGSSGCSGPFCISSDMMAGSGGSTGGMGGGMMGGAGGVGAFSPFGMAASGDRASGGGGGASSCNGPFCTMASTGMGDHSSGY